MFERKGRRKVSCRQVDAWLMAYLKDGLAPDRRAGVDEHLAGCEVCRHAMRNARAMEAGLRLEAARYKPTLSPTASARIQERVYRRMRRSMVTQRVSRFAWGAVGILVLALITVTGYMYWQGWQQASGQSTPVAGPTPPEMPVIPTVTPVLPQSDAVVIAFACSNDDRGYYQELAEAFHEENPSIEVQVVASDAVFGDEDGDLRELAASADSFALKRSLEPRDIQSGLLRDLQPLVEADLVFSADDFYPGLLDRYRWQGRLWGLPSPGTPLLLFYDKAAFDEAGLPYPEPGWSFKEFEIAAGVLTQEQGEETARYGLVVSPRSLAGPILVMGRAEGWAEGVDVLSEPFLNAPAVVEAAQWFVDLARLRGFMPNLYEPRGEAIPIVAEQVQEGRAAIWDGWPSAYTLSVYRDAYESLGVAPFPEGMPIVDWVGGAPYSMSAGTAHPDEVWRWLRFLTSQPGDVKEVRPPVRRSVAEATGYWDELDVGLSTTIRYVMERPKVAPPPGMANALQTALNAALAEGQGIEEALTQAQRELARVLGMSSGQVPAPPVATSQTAEMVITHCSHEDQPYRELADVFRELHPEIAVDVSVSFDGLTGYARKCDCFDTIFLLGHLDRPEVQKLVLDLQPFVDADPSFPGDFYPGVLDTARREGKLYGLPAFAALQLVYYNKDLFDQAGIPYPEPGWTPDDFGQTASLLTSGEGESKIYGYTPDGFMGELFDLNFYIEQFGGFAEYEAIEARTQLAPLNPAETLAAVRWYTDLKLTQEAMPAFPGQQEAIVAKRYEVDFEPFRDLVASKHVAMWTTLQNTTYYPRLTFPLGAAALPLKEGPIRQYSVASYVISASSSQPDACWQWIRFLLDQPLAAVRGTPVRRSLLESPEFVGQVEKDELTAIQFSLERLDSISHRFNLALHAAYETIMNGTPVEAAVDEALRRDAAARACLDAVPGQLRDEDIAACLEKVGLTPIVGVESAED
jgi:multiple sugar transport system substrate-binding protein